MGRESARAVVSAEDLELVLAVDPAFEGASLCDLCDPLDSALKFLGSLEGAISEAKAHVLLDFTQPEAAVPNALAALRAGVSPVVGTSGIGEKGLSDLRAECEKTGVPAMVVPNFAIGAVLMMRFAEEAARWLPDAEIVEMHHNRKADAPSGTAMLTAERIASARTGDPQPDPTRSVKAPGARGGSHLGVPVHSVRLPGLLAHQCVLFGGPGEALTIRHDSLDRSSFMPGVLLAIRSVRGLSGLVVGLDSLLFGCDGPGA